MPTEIVFSTDPRPSLDAAEHWYFVGRLADLETLGRGDDAALLPAALLPLWDALLSGLKTGDGAKVASTLVSRPDRTPARATVIAVPSRASRHNAPARADALLAATRGRFSKGESAVVLVPAADGGGEELLPWTLALARSQPLYTQRNGGQEAPASRVVVTTPRGDLGPAASRLEALSAAVRRAAALVDSPPNTLGVDRFVSMAEDAGRDLGAQVTVLRLAELEARGFGGLVGVGKAASEEPALVHLRWDPPNPSAEPVAWVGKGIVFDTGGLSMKGKNDMPGMKMDMGGAAAVLAAFEAACRLGLPRRIDAILCLAENAVGPKSVKPDDIIRLYSGKTVEINNTDAEGRLVLADGVAFAARDLGATLICDLATLTGAQLVSTGKQIAAIVSNDEALEDAARAAGKRAGEPVFPLPFSPELFRSEFASAVADLKNSVKDRMNGQTSCAAQFIAESLDLDAVRWLHVDLAGPAVSRERGTGFGVGLLLTLFGEGTEGASQP